MRDQADEEMNKCNKECYDECAGTWDMHMDQAMK